MAWSNGEHTEIAAGRARIRILLRGSLLERYPGCVLYQRFAVKGAYGNIETSGC